VYPASSEVTLLIDRRQVIPVINTRTGERSLAYGLPQAGSDRLELRFVRASTDTQVGDILTTSGIDGVYPPGLPVAKVEKVSDRGQAGFAHIVCEPMAHMEDALHVLVVEPQDKPSMEKLTSPEAKP
jgi:rod shape-determining protein MreC